MPQLVIWQRFRFRKAYSEMSGQSANLPEGKETWIVAPWKTACNHGLVVPNDLCKEFQFCNEINVTDDGPLKTLWLKQSKNEEENKRYDFVQLYYKFKISWGLIRPLVLTLTSWQNKQSTLIENSKSFYTRFRTTCCCWTGDSSVKNANTFSQFFTRSWHTICKVRKSSAPFSTL